MPPRARLFELLTYHPCDRTQAAQRTNIPPVTEEQLTKRLKEGDNEARKELYERFAGGLLSLVERYVGNREEARDVLHDGFIHVFTVSIHRFTWRGDGSLTAWLRRVFTNYVLTYLERERHLAVDGVEQLPDTPDDDDPPPAIDMDTIHRLIGELPIGYRTVLNLFLIEGWSHAEIAQKLHIGESTSASQYLRAKKLLKAKIQTYIENQES